MTKRADTAASVEAAWLVAQGVLSDHAPCHLDAPGSWGPAAADDFDGDDGPWHNPQAATRER